MRDVVVCIIERKGKNIGCDCACAGEGVGVWGCGVGGVCRVRGGTA